ncbi:hypothetical protein K501DRAFT_320699 [Backusella circina FSU 941]|nr:hypothetical protein K501DRAFT_320699 [Backusella circina FSU 941]
MTLIALNSQSNHKSANMIMGSLQFVWFIGHVGTLLGSLAYFLSFLTFQFNQLAYRMAFMGALLSYSVVIYKSYCQATAKGGGFTKDENIQYFLVALFWYFSDPISVTLIPYFIFSTFHAMGYIRKVILPVIFHPIQEETDIQMFQQRLKQYSDSYYGSAMRCVAQIEVILILGRLFLGLIFGFRVVSFFVFTQFLKFRYNLSSYTRHVFKDVRTLLDRILIPPTASVSIPPIITNCYITTRDIIIRYGQMGSSRQQ